MKRVTIELTLEECETVAFLLGLGIEQMRASVTLRNATGCHLRKLSRAERLAAHLATTSRKGHQPTLL